MPCLIGQTDQVHPAVAETLQNLYDNHFPLQSTEFREGSIERASFQNVFQSLLDALCASRSSVILTFLINCTAADTKHIMEWKIQEAIGKYMQHQSVEQQVNSLTIPFRIFCDTTIDPGNRASFVKRFMLSMIRNSSVDAIVLFYAEHIKQIVGLADKCYGFGTTKWDIEHAFTSRMGGYELIEAMIGMVRKERITDIHCPIGISLLGKLLD